METEIQFRDALRRKMTVGVLEHAIGELSDKKMNYRTALLSCTLLRTNYRTAQQVLVITSRWVIQSFKDFCRKFSYKSTVSRKSFVQDAVIVFALFNKQYTRVLLTA